MEAALFGAAIRCGKVGRRLIGAWRFRRGSRRCRPLNRPRGATTARASPAVRSDKRWSHSRSSERAGQCLPIVELRPAALAASGDCAVLRRWIAELGSVRLAAESRGVHVRIDRDRRSGPRTDRVGISRSPWPNCAGAAGGVASRDDRQGVAGGYSRRGRKARCRCTLRWCVAVRHARPYCQRGAIQLTVRFALDRGRMHRLLVCGVRIGGIVWRRIGSGIGRRRRIAVTGPMEQIHSLSKRPGRAWPFVLSVDSNCQGQQRDPGD